MALNKMTLPEILAEDGGSVDSVLAVIADLCGELRLGQVQDWENPTLLQFLEAMRAWLETMGPRVGERPSWKLVEAMVRAAKVYE